MTLTRVFRALTAPRILTPLLALVASLAVRGSLPTIAAAAPAAADAPAFQLSDLKRLVSLSDPAISPDGTRIAVLVSTPNWKTDKRDQEIDLVEIASGAKRALTYKRTGLGSPKWSPDGSRLAFLADDTPDKDSDGPHAQIFVMPMNGGDAVRVTATAHGVEEFSWSPDGTRIAYITADDAPNAKAIKDHDDAFQVTDNHFLTREAATPYHLWVIPSAGGVAQRLTTGSFSLQTDQRDNAPLPAWNPTGTAIAFTRFPGPYWGPSFHSVIDAVAVPMAPTDVPGAGTAPAPHTLVSAEGADAARYAPIAPGTSSTRAAAQGAALAAASDAQLAYLRPRGGDQNNGNAVYVHAPGANSGADLDVTAALARNVNAFAWLPGGHALLLEAGDGTHTTLWQIPLPSGAPHRLELGDVQPNPEISIATTGAVAFIGSTATHPGELYVLDSPRAKPRCLTTVNAFVDGLTLGHTDTLDWDGPGGFHEDGVLTYPVGYNAGTKYPLVLVIHGGPTSASTVKFSSLPQLLAAAGFLVFQPNYRGSDSLGDAYQHAIFRDTGDGPGKDVMAGLAAVEKLGVVDTAQIGVSGWSYGGYMTTWLTGHETIWKAAMAGAALTDWVMDYTVAYYQEGDTYMFGGSPWTREFQDIWRVQSPISYASHVTAPTLILGDVGDPNVPLINSYEWFHALRDAKVPVEFYAYPADTHFPNDIVRTTDVYRRWVDWMKQHLQ